MNILKSPMEKSTGNLHVFPFGYLLLKTPWGGSTAASLLIMAFLWKERPFRVLDIKAIAAMKKTNVEKLTFLFPARAALAMQCRGNRFPLGHHKSSKNHPQSPPNPLPEAPKSTSEASKACFGNNTIFQTPKKIYGRGGFFGKIRFWPAFWDPKSLKFGSKMRKKRH